jgi:hypothetical protein
VAAAKSSHDQSAAELKAFIAKLDARARESGKPAAAAAGRANR